MPILRVLTIEQDFVEAVDNVAERLDDITASLREMLAELFSTPLAAIEDAAILLDVVLEYDVGDISDVPEEMRFLCPFLRSLKAAAPAIDFATLRHSQDRELVLTSPIDLRPI